MTNATAADLSEAPSTGSGEQKMTLRYKGGEKIVVVPANVPVVTFQPTSADDQKVLLVPSARVLVNAQQKDGKPTVLRRIVGRGGSVPPCEVINTGCRQRTTPAIQRANRTSNGCFFRLPRPRWPGVNPNGQCGAMACRDNRDQPVHP